MSQAPDLSPPIDASVERDGVTFDFGPIMSEDETIVSILSMTCEVFSGPDTDPASRLLDSPIITTSVSTGATASAVVQDVGNMVAGTTYRLQCVVQTSLGENSRPSLWTRLPCTEPN